MRSRPFILFWGATAGAILFLGAAWSTMGRLRDGAATPADAVVLTLALIGLAGTSFVAGRIAYVTARAQRRSRNEAANRVV